MAQELLSNHKATDEQHEKRGLPKVDSSRVFSDRDDRGR